jgi:NAD(P)-dependent dehydrogenase (short-subunit alcohol dehydrogenase family)
MISSGSPTETDLFTLRDRIAVVTGGGRGLGKAIAEALASFGAKVILLGRNAEVLAAATQEMSKRGLSVDYHSCDVADVSSVEAVDDWLFRTYGIVDTLVNNAGINPYYAAPEATPIDHWQEVINVNLTGVFLGCKIFGNRMLKAGRGSIINVTSIAGHVGLPKSTAYCAAKGGVELMSRSLALDWARKGVRVNCIAPGYFETDLTAGLREHSILSERLLAKTPLARFGRPNELGGAAVFLASEAAAYVTGQTILVDGGWTAG